MAGQSAAPLTWTGGQQEMQRAPICGAPGVLLSGLMWLAPSVVWQTAGIVAGFAALFIEGALIMPLAVLIARFGFRALAPVTLPFVRWHRSGAKV